MWGSSPSRRNECRCIGGRGLPTGSGGFPGPARRAALPACRPAMTRLRARSPLVPAPRSGTSRRGSTERPPEAGHWEEGRAAVRRAVPRGGGFPHGALTGAGVEHRLGRRRGCRRRGCPSVVAGAAWEANAALIGGEETESFVKISVIGCGYLG